MSNIDTARSASTDISGDLANLRDDVTKLASSVTQLVQQQASSASETVTRAAHDARDRLSGTMSDAQQKLQSASGELESYVERNPGIALAVAFGLGVAFELMNRSR